MDSVFHNPFALHLISIDPTVLIAINRGLRWANLIAWGIVGFWGSWSFIAVCIRRFVFRDTIWAALFLLAIGVEVGQIRVLAGVVPHETDQWITLSLVSVFLSAVGIFGARAYQAPDGHKRAALIAHGLILLILFTVGVLM